jgi:hypothetical protein
VEKESKKKRHRIAFIPFVAPKEQEYHRSVPKSRKPGLSELVVALCIGAENSTGPIRTSSCSLFCQADDPPDILEGEKSGRPGLNS